MVGGVWHEEPADRDAFSDGRDEFLEFRVAFAVEFEFEFEAERYGTSVRVDHVSDHVQVEIRGKGIY